jgi:hypothetical protein
MILIYFPRHLVFDGAMFMPETRMPLHTLNNGEARSFELLPSLHTARIRVCEQFVLGTCRCWDAFVTAPDPTLPIRKLAPVFAYMNVLGALCAFERAFQTLKAASPRGLKFYDCEATQISLDEARLLSALASLQHADTRAAVTVLRAPLPDATVRAVLPPLARIASLLGAQGHHLPPWGMA